MTKTACDKAKEMIATAAVEGNAADAREWLDAHLKDCGECAQMAMATGRALKSLRSLSIPIDPGLADRTRLRVYLRALELNARQPVMAGLWILCALSWMSIVASASYLWQGFEWVGRWIGIPGLFWQMGFALWWVLPIVLGVAVLSRTKTHLGD